MREKRTGRHGVLTRAMPVSEMPYGLIRKLSNAFWVEFYCERVLRSAGFAPDDRAQRGLREPRFALNYCRSGDI